MFVCLFLFFFFLYRHTRLFRCFLFLFFSAFKDDALHRNTLESEKRPKTADTIRSNESSKEEFSVFPYERSPSTNQKSKHTRDQKDAASVKARTRRQVSSDEDGKYEGRSFSFWSSHVSSDNGDGSEVQYILFNKQDKNLTCAANFFVHFFAVAARLPRENAYFHVLWRT